jgi:Fe-S oxidoreductase
MEQSRLREYESKCVQEEPPFCQAACPLHVDARAVCGETKRGRTDEAFKALLRVLPLPRLLTRLCEEPCKAACKRGPLGGALEIRMIERHCVERGAPPKPPFLPQGGKKIAVAGSGLSSLVAAWDLARKGHLVTVFHGPALGAGLAERLPEDLETEIEALKKMKTSFSPLEPGPGFIENLREKFDQVYVGVDDPCVSRPIEESGLFWGGDAGSYIERASQGRRAALSIVRDLQGASLSAGRDREGAFETRLFTSTAGVAPAPPSEDPTTEAARCLECQCLECVKVCGYLRAYKGYPKKYAREIYNNLSVVQGSRTANRMINSCTGCGLCASVCPNGFHMGEFCAEARLEMTRSGKMPPSAHEFALLDMEHADTKGALFRPGKDLSLWFFPGCQLGASDPGLVKRVYSFLAEKLGAGLWLECCGAPARWAGEEAMFGQKKRALAERDIGGGTVICACPACLATLRQSVPEIKAVSVWEALLGLVTPKRDNGAFALYLPCTVRDDPKTAGAIREFALASGAEAESNAGECCGYGGLQSCANPALADDAARRLARGTSKDLLVACAMCRDMFASVGKRTAHLLETLFPDATVPDPAARHAPRLSQRRENRERLREDMLAEFWREERICEMSPLNHVSVRLEMTPDVKERLDKRRILDEDVLRVVTRAEATGRKMTSPEGYHVAYLRPRSVTTWVEYTVETLPEPVKETVYRVSNAWSHRMTVPGSQPEEQ